MMPRILFATAALAGLAHSAEPQASGVVFELSPPDRYCPQYFARVAWSAEAKVWLVVWQDGDPTADLTAETPAQEIRAVRVSAEGKVLDAKPIEVASARGGRQRPVVASDGKGFLVAWHDFRNGKDWDVYAATVSADGKAGGAELLAGGTHNQCFVDLACAGGSYYAAWMDMRHWPEYRIYGSRLSPQGKALDGSGVELVRAMNDAELEAWKKAPFAPGKMGKGWHHFGVKGMEGVKQPGPPSLGAAGKTLVVACEIEGEHSDGIAVRVLDAASGQPAGALQKVEGRGSKGYLHWTRPSLAGTAQGLLLATHLATGSWGSGPGTWVLAKLDAAGKAGAFGDVVTLDSKYPPGYRSYSNRHAVLGLAWDGTRGLFVCEHHRHEAADKNGPGTPGNVDVLALPVDEEGKPLSSSAPLELAAGPATQSAPAVATGPEGVFLVVWQEEEPAKDSRIMARLVNSK